VRARDPAKRLIAGFEGPRSLVTAMLLAIYEIEAKFRAPAGRVRAAVWRRA